MGLRDLRWGRLRRSALGLYSVLNVLARRRYGKSAEELSCNEIMSLARELLDPVALAAVARATGCLGVASPLDHSPIIPSPENAF